MPGLRLLLRFAPFAVGAIAAAVWLRRRQARRALLEAPPPRRALEPARQHAEPAEEVAPEPRPRSGRFARGESAAHPPEPIDIVTVVDDLLLADR